jgi:hypothetical protein
MFNAVLLKAINPLPINIAGLKKKGLRPAA